MRLAHNGCNSMTRMVDSSFVPIHFHNNSGDDSPLNFEKLVKTTIDKDDKMNRENIAKSSEDYKSLKTGCSEFLDCYRFLDFNLNKASAISTSLPPLDAKRKEDELFKKTSLAP